MARKVGFSNAGARRVLALRGGGPFISTDVSMLPASSVGASCDAPEWSSFLTRCRHLAKKDGPRSASTWHSGAPAVSKSMEHTTIWPGEPYPLGATFDGTGTNFSLFSEVAERVELCLFDEQGKETRVDLVE